MDLRPISESWRSIERWVHERERTDSLAAPATPQEIETVQERIAVQLPPEIVELLKRHNGSTFPFPPFYLLLGTQEIILKFETKRSAWGESTFAPWSRHWVPFASDGSAGALYVDTAPGSDGRVHEHTREGDSTLSSHPMWTSITALMHHTAEALDRVEQIDGYRPYQGDDDLIDWEDVTDDGEEL
ncbi:SMI1/KNR4 family protein [Streptomyces synnematoformans]|uniref:Knr4/Smi1-like domain-containing protein n=1 Tax=Streptomyces synnematoformans TaxID=415721 RepID=A0ABP5JKL4_9ACTN